MSGNKSGVQSLGRTTAETSFADQIKRYKTNMLPPEPEPEIRPVSRFARRGKNPAHESLVNKSVAVIAANFHKRPVTVAMPPELQNLIAAQLPLDLDVAIAAKHVHTESYWKRRAAEQLGKYACPLDEHGFLWKQMLLETSLQEALEEFEGPKGMPLQKLRELVEACADHVFTLKLRQLPSHFDLGELFVNLPNLTRLDITFGFNKVGMEYDRMRFGLKVSDAQALARYFPQCSVLTSLTLQCNIIDDDLLKMLFNGLSQNSSVTSLDLAHNRISNHGVRLLSKLLMDPNCVLTRLNIADNQIHVEGGRYLGRGLRENTSLYSLDVHMNRLEDDGVRMLLEGLQDNVTLHSLNLRANGAGSDTAQAISALLRDSQHQLQYIDLAANNLSAHDISLIHMAVMRNRSLWSLDLRGNPGMEENEPLIEEIEKVTRNNELAIHSLSKPKDLDSNP